MRKTLKALAGDVWALTSPKSSRYDAEFSKALREIAPDWFREQEYNSDARKEALLTLAKSGHPKPRRDHELGNAVHDYLNPNRKQYDSELYNEIKLLRPDWFARTSDSVTQKREEDYAKLEELAKSGGARPALRSYLGRRLTEWTTRSRFNHLDFCEKIERLAPTWFSPAGKRRKQIVELASKGAPKPHHKSALGITLNNSVARDSKFREELQTIRPDWFQKPSVVNKRELLKLASTNAKKPLYKTSLGQALARYTNPNGGCYDEMFVDSLRKLNPQWLTDLVYETKNTLLEMARKGEPRPAAGKHVLGTRLKNYTSSNSTTFDEEFTRQLFLIRPEWSVRRTISPTNKKVELLAMAERKEARPAGKHHLAQSLSAYTRITNYSFDAEFTTKLRMLAPKWFVASDRLRRSKRNARLLAKTAKATY